MFEPGRICTNASIFQGIPMDRVTQIKWDRKMFKFKSIIGYPSIELEEFILGAKEINSLLILHSLILYDSRTGAVLANGE